jgi:hypothetical protein
LANLGPQEQGSESSSFYTLLGLALVAVVLVGGFFAIRAAVGFLTSASPQLGSAIIGAGGLVAVALVANVWSKQLEHRRQIQEEQRKKKAEVYEEFMGFWFGVLTGNESEEDPSGFQTKVQNYIRGFTHKLAAWGSEAFLKEYGIFKERIKHDTGGAILAFEKVLLAIRTDLGYNNKGLDRGDLLKIFLDEDGINQLLIVEALAEAQSLSDGDEQQEPDKAKFKG